jgi:hypothetical protein
MFGLSKKEKEIKRLNREVQKLKSEVRFERDADISTKVRVWVEARIQDGWHDGHRMQYNECLNQLKHFHGLMQERQMMAQEPDKYFDQDPEYKHAGLSPTAR